MEILAKYGVDGKYFADNFFTHFTSCENVVTLAQAIIHKQLFELTGGFSISMLLGTDFQRDFFLRAKKMGSTMTATLPICQNVPDLKTIMDDKFSRYVSQAFMVRCGLKRECNSDEEKNFILDLPENNIRELPELLKENNYYPPEQPPLRIVLVSGAWEYHHNKLTFYNYFKLLEGKRKLTFIPRLDRIIAPESDLLAADLVIISRGRSENILKIIDYCEHSNIPALYMIDDNWLAIGEDYPELYGNLFAPGKPDYEVFIESLKRCSAVVLYNRILEEDIKPYAQRVFRIPPNIYADDFAGSRNLTLPDEVQNLLEWRKQSEGTIIGYAGSARFTDVAFRALAQASDDPSLKIRVFLFGTFLPDHLKLFKGKPTILPFTSYESYAHIMNRLTPDIMVAPLENNRTSMSKCPNKYLEYSISGSAGVYSDIYPYNETVKHRLNGLLVSTDAGEKSWLDAIKELIEDKKLRIDIIHSAKQDVLENYETKKVLPKFLAMLDQLVLAK